jgi:O-acetyl-ADP-ribose deacetylase
VTDVRTGGRRLARCGPAEVWLWRGDITDLEVEAIVNAANNQGWLGSGVAGAIRGAAGDEVEAEAVAQGPWEVGGAVRTGPGRLGERGVRVILHAAAMGAGVRASAESVAAATAAALDLAAAEGLSSIALPALGTGVGGLAYPACAAAMAGALRRHCAGPTSLRLVAFALYDAAAVEEFGPVLVRELDGGDDRQAPAPDRGNRACRP